jgi:hypothetical protein
MSKQISPPFNSHYTTQLSKLPHSIKCTIWQRLTTRKYPLTIEEASSIHPEVEAMLVHELSRYEKNKERQRLKTAAISTGNTDSLKKLTLFEKELTVRDNLLRQQEQEYTSKIEQARSEIRDSILKENKSYLTTEKQRLQIDNDKYVEGLHKLKRNLENQYTEKMNSFGGLSLKIRQLEDIIIAKDNCIFGMYHRSISKQMLDKYVEPMKYTDQFEKEKWNRLREEAMQDFRIRKKYTFRQDSMNAADKLNSEVKLAMLGKNVESLEKFVSG